MAGSQEAVEAGERSRKRHPRRKKAGQDQGVQELAHGSAHETQPGLGQLPEIPTRALSLADKPRLAGRFQVSAGTHIEVALLRQEGIPVVELREVNGGETEAGGLRIPAAMLPELKRAIGRLEEDLSEQGELEDFEDAAAYRGKGSVFANDSEREFAALLDFYRIRWQYEPTTFPIVWDAQGRVAESFTPDFYLTDFNLFIELTTMKQSLVTRKNRKVRLFREHYPERPIRIFYGRDYRALIAKYGLGPAAANSVPTEKAD